jgi:hypothetical protein
MGAFSLRSSDIINEFGEKDPFRVKDDTDRTHKQEEQKKKVVKTNYFPFPHCGIF